MTRQDAIRLVAVVVAAYPGCRRFADDDNVDAMITLWTEMLDDVDARIVQAAVKQHIATCAWPPSVADIRGRVVKLVRPDIIPPDQAWTAVSDLIVEAGEFNHGDLYSQLPPLVARAVETVGWTCLYQMHRSASVGRKPGMDRVAFLEQYEPMYQRTMEQAMMPQSLREQMAAVTAQIPDGGRSLLTVREQGRREKDAAYAACMSSIELAAARAICGILDGNGADSTDAAGGADPCQ